MKIKENEKWHKYLNLSWELRKAKEPEGDVMVIPLVIGVLGTISKGLVSGLKVLEIGGRAETIPTAEFFRRVLEIWGDLFSDRLQKKTIS